MCTNARAPAGNHRVKIRDLLDAGPLSGPIVLTYSKYDRALCLWHRLSELGKPGIGCHGVTEPRNRIGKITMKDVTLPYGDNDFAADITNVDASTWYRTGGFAERAHSDFLYPQTLHLIASVTLQLRSRAAHESKAAAFSAAD